MGKMKVYTNVYFKNGEYFMISANCFRSRMMAEKVALCFCDGHKDGSFWEYKIEELGLYE